MKLAIIILALAAFAEAAPTSRPTKVVALDTCLNSDCHADLARAPVVHGPITSAACDACHELADAKSHTYRLIRKDADLCTFCHEFDLSAKPVVHKPAKLGQCMGCHDPHSGPTKALLREASVAATCRRCHEDIAHGRAFLHTPVKEGACDSCHPPHAARFPKLLDLAGTDLCLACHRGFESRVAQAKFVHEAMKQGCEKCHDPHGSKNAMSTTQPTVAQCGGCHAKTIAAAANAQFPHTPVMSDSACVGCHTPHAGNLAKLMSDTPQKLCMSCHAKDVKTPQGRVVPAVAQLTAPNPIKHGPIKEGSCAGCHGSHGGDRQLFLTKNYSTRFYQRFEPAQYELCFSCHEARLVTDTITATHTAFRNGKQNLHALHVRDTGNRGENCRDCHATHASGDHGLVRDALQYGLWKMPMRFARTSTGGACFPGCHPRYGYDRNNPIKNSPGVATTLPTSLPATMPIRLDAPALIVLNATDTTGARIQIPQGPLPIVLHVTNMLTTALPARAQRDDARTITILTAPRPATQPALPFIPDPDGFIAAQLDICGFPTTLILKSDGSEIARISGAPESLALKLSTYIDLAAGRIASPATQPKLIADAPAQASARMIRRIEHLINTRNAEEALKLLPALPKDALPSWRYNLLLARALIAQGRFAEAKDPARAAGIQNPASPDAHLVLGQIYEQEKNYPAAAAEYRAALTPVTQPSKR